MILKEDEEAEDEFDRVHNLPIEVHVHLPDGDVFPINAPRFVIAAGANSGHVAKLVIIKLHSTSIFLYLNVKKLFRLEWELVQRFFRSHFPLSLESATSTTFIVPQALDSTVHWLKTFTKN